MLCPPAHAEQRIALVVGNSGYTDMPRLANPANDAELIARTLESVGFDVMTSINADRATLTSSINKFGDSLAYAGRGAVGLFFFAGHGVQSRGVNYLIPLGESIDNENQLQTNAVPAQWVLDRMEQAGNVLNMVILDACRTPPPKLQANSRSIKSGLTQMEGPAGALIAYSAGPGQEAVDGRGQHSPYAEALASAISATGVRIEDVFRQVRSSVKEATRDAQTPWESVSLTGPPFYFLPPDQPPPPPTIAAAQPRFQVERPQRASTTEIEVADRVMYATSRSNVRKGPDVSYDTVDQLEIGQSVNVTGKVVGRNWFRVQLEGRTGFVHGPLLAERLPTVEPPNRGRSRHTPETRWRAVADGRPWELEEYLVDFPESKYAGEARRRVTTAFCADSYIAKSYLSQYADGMFAEDAKGCLLTLIANINDVAMLEAYTEPFGQGTEAIVAAARRRTDMLRSWAVLQDSTDMFALQEFATEVEDPVFKRHAQERVVAAIKDASDLQLRQYVRTFPNGSATREAQKRIEALDTWSQIESEEDLALFERFVRNTMDSEFANLARERILRLVNESEDAAQLERYVKAFPDGAGVQAAEYRIAVLGNVLEDRQKAHRVFSDCPHCPEMVVIPAGQFSMGSPSFEQGRNKDEGPRRIVTFKQAFALSVHEITFDEWDACLADGRCNGWQPPSPWGRKKMPVVNVSRFDVEAYIAWLNRIVGESKYRLPSEAEWEYAARANSTAPFNLGATVTPEQANFRARTGPRKIRHRKKTTEVGTFPRNAFDLYDTHGNIAEWVSDCWHEHYTNAPKDGSSWGGSSCRYGIVRGGSWQSKLSDLRLANRHRMEPGARENFVGFRLARDLP